MSTPTDSGAAEAQPGAMTPGFAQALRFWSWLGWISFGGPAGQIAVMHRELVERRRWASEAVFLHGLNYCMLLPGPEAMQLAVWLGWRMHGVRGGVAAGALFVLPATVILALLSWLYLRYGGVPLVAGALSGIQAATLAIVLQAMQRIGSRVLRTPLAFALALAAFVALFALRWPFPVVIGGAALAGFATARFAPRWLPPPASHGPAAPQTPSAAREANFASAFALAGALLAAWWLPLLLVRGWLGAESTAWQMGLFFSKAALVTLGGAYAVLPYVAQQAVEVHGWLGPEQMLIGLGLAESTPGPLIMVLEFVGFVGGWQHPDLASSLASALLGAAVTVWATFLPSFLFVLPAAPWIERLRGVRALDAALTAITAAVVGAIASLALWFGWRLFAGSTPVAMAFAAIVALAAWFGLRRGWAVGWVVIVSAAAGAAAAALQIV